MGIIISADGLADVVPIQIVVRLECDEGSEIFCRGFEDFRSRDGLIGARKLATKAGWTERKNAWVCPRCSGKGE